MPPDFLPFSGYRGNAVKGREREKTLFRPFVGTNFVTDPEHACNGLAIMNASGHDHADGDAEREEFEFDDFILFRLRGAGTQAAGKINGHGFSHEARAGIEIQDSLPASGSVAGLFEE